MGVLRTVNILQTETLYSLGYIVIQAKRGVNVGRKQKPTTQKVIEGTFRADRANPDEPVYDTVLPDPPDFLDAIAIEHWNTKGQELFDKGLISEVNSGVFAMACWHWSIWVDAIKKLKGEDLVDETIKGSIIQNYHLGIANTASENYRKKIIEFGGTPASAMKVSAKKKQKAGPWDGFNQVK